MDITNIRRMAKELNLHNIYKAPLSLFESDLPNVEFLELILKTELEERKAKNLYKARKASRLPKTTHFDQHTHIWTLIRVTLNLNVMRIFY